ncbi:Uncharacterised protein [Serratia marcescens]|nr:Uncharacterised protein [Serratia marcescens]
MVSITPSTTARECLRNCAGGSCARGTDGRSLSSPRRSQQPSGASATPIKKGIRHPHSAMAFGSPESTGKAALSASAVTPPTTVAMPCVANDQLE